MNSITNANSGIVTWLIHKTDQWLSTLAHASSLHGEVCRNYVSALTLHSFPLIYLTAWMTYYLLYKSGIYSLVRECFFQSIPTKAMNSWPTMPCATDSMQSWEQDSPFIFSTALVSIKQQGYHQHAGRSVIVPSAHLGLQCLMNCITTCAPQQIQVDLWSHWKAI